MTARLIIAALAVLFLMLAAVRIARDAGRVGPAARTWLLIALIFAAVTLWQWLVVR